MVKKRKSQKSFSIERRVREGGNMKEESYKKCPSCGLINPISAIQCDCGYNFSESYESLLKKYQFESEEKVPGKTIKCSICGEYIKLPTYHRENIYTGEKQYFCEKCWISSVPLRQIFTLSKKHRKQRISQMDEEEKRAYDILTRRYHTMKSIKWIILIIVVIGAFFLIRSCF